MLHSLEDCERPAATAAPTALGESGEQRGQDRGGAKPLQVSTRGRHSVDPWSTHRPPLGTPRYGEVFLKAAWRGVRPTPLKPREQWIPSTPFRQVNHG